MKLHFQGKSLLNYLVYNSTDIVCMCVYMYRYVVHSEITAIWYDNKEFYLGSASKRIRLVYLNF